MGASTDLRRSGPLARPADTRRLSAQLGHLRHIIDQFSRNPRVMGGLEIEVHLVDNQGRPYHGLNLAVLKELRDKRVVPELGPQLELNLTPVEIHGRPFTALLNEAENLVRQIQRTLQKLRVPAQVVLVGTLPTLTREDLALDKITASPRYPLLNKSLWKDQRAKRFTIPKQNGGHWSETVSNVALEMACTSCQGHYQQPDFVNGHNTLLAIAGALGAVSGNAPFWLGRPSIPDIRKILFKAATHGRCDWNAGYIGQPMDAFETIQNYPVILTPKKDTEDVAAVIQSGRFPQLKTMRIQIGTYWPMVVRPVYDPAPGNPNVRSENREDSAGPTLRDVIGTYAFRWGLLRNPAINQAWRQLPYQYVLENLEAMTHQGVDAKIWWPVDGKPRQLDACQLVLRLLPFARQGLIDTGVDPSEADLFLSFVAGRANRRISGSKWQQERVQCLLSGGLGYTRAVQHMFAEYRHLSAAGLGHPVGHWPNPRVPESLLPEPNGQRTVAHR